MDDNHLGDFLRACRAGLQPEHVGMASYGGRRVAGLRREEVAVLAGVNADYYTRLEQGRERHPSSQVVDRHPVSRRKDRSDLDAALPHMSPAQRETLAELLDRVHPGHPWIADL